MIETRKSRVPWSWVVLMNLPWVSMIYVEMLSGQALTFTLKKFMDSPRLISFLLSINILFNFLVGAITSFMSDRIWTRWGRRRPFLIFGWLGVAICLIAVPLASTIWMLAIVIVLYQFFQDIAKPLEPLYNEVIPPPQRGRAYTLRSILFTLNGLMFSGVMIRNWDKTYDLSAIGIGWKISGEQFAYWFGTLFMLMIVAFLVFFVTEQRPTDEAPRARISSPSIFIRQFFGDIFGDRHAWMIYLIYTCPLLAAAGAGPMITLVQLDQLGYTREMMGFVGMVGTPIGLTYVLFAGFLADRVSRLRMFQLGIIIPPAIGFMLFLLMRFYFNYNMSIWIFFAFGIVGGLFGAMTSVAWGPLIYDYIPKNRMGSISAGFSFVNGLLGFLIMNLAGQWVHYWTAFFGNPGAGKYDYSSVYLLQITLASVAFGLTVFFAHEVKVGRVLALGKLDAPGHAPRGFEVVPVAKADVLKTDKVDENRK